MKKVSIIDVARQAGVSVSTVSLVLREKGKISAATIDKVHAAIEALGYVHNVAAANLRGKTSNLIGLVVEDLNDPFSTRVTASLVQALEAQGFMVFLTQPGRETGRLESCLVSFTRQGVAGVVYLTADSTQRALPAPVVQSTLPLVVVSQSPVEEKLNSVVRDNRQAGGLATRYLIERGHRNIAYIGGTAGCLIREERLYGYRAALSQYGLPWRDEFARACAEETLAVSQTVRQLLEANNKITALLCHSPHAIIGCLEAIHQVGRTVGKDVFLTQQVSLIGFEDMMHVNLTSPSFTYVSSASEETGRQAAGLIVRLIREPGLPAQRITLSGQLIARGSA
ncbi:Mal regulon transcriptional regulator MalI [Cronobacter universalis]|uniref:Mal regulon transcriptional regulator MalI n=1 Tax=Cronobacter universalis TaxID=535744 RepID=UPI0024AF825F|nr:Mal regulon transcriptional regulator MalI [Cronobacter universalis]MDI7661823.1 Mal regulon transcriptional regulator MalI [Cronobacter universalis]